MSMETVYFGDLAVTYDPENKNLHIRHMRVEMQVDVFDQGQSLVVVAQNSRQTQAAAAVPVPQMERVELRISPYAKQNHAHKEKCVLCGEEFGTYAELRAHQSRHDPDGIHFSELGLLK